MPILVMVKYFIYYLAIVAFSVLLYNIIKYDRLLYTYLRKNKLIVGIFEHKICTNLPKQKLNCVNTGRSTSECFLLNKENCRQKKI